MCHSNRVVPRDTLLLGLDGGWGRSRRRSLDPPTMAVALLLLVIISGVAGEARSPRVVETRQGKLRGIIRPLANKALRPVEVFLGVPYATPPIGSNRFSPTRAPGPWDGEREARQYGPVCPQLLPHLTSPSVPTERLLSARKLANHLTNQAEDCLYLNVFVPSQGETYLLLLHQKCFELFSSSAATFFPCFSERCASKI